MLDFLWTLLWAFWELLIVLLLIITFAASMEK